MLLFFVVQNVRIRGLRPNRRTSTIRPQRQSCPTLGVSQSATRIYVNTPLGLAAAENGTRLTSRLISRYTTFCEIREEAAKSVQPSEPKVTAVIAVLL